MKIPCEDCLILPICRHKPFCTLFDECPMLRKCDGDWEVVHLRNSYFMDDLVRTLKPTQWIYRMDYTFNTLHPRVMSVKDVEDGTLDGHSYLRMS